MRNNDWCSTWGSSIPMSDLPEFPAWSRTGTQAQPTAGVLREMFENDAHLTSVGHFTVMDGYVYNLRVTKTFDGWGIEVGRLDREQYDYFRSGGDPESTAEWALLKGLVLALQNDLSWDELAAQYDQVITDEDALRHPVFPPNAEKVPDATVFDLFGVGGYDISGLK
jgi:hypothetical protein